jgi:hypothetical protein
MAVAKKKAPVVKAPVIDLSEFRRIRKPGCAFAQLELKPEHVDVLKAAMQAPDISGAAVWEWLKDKKYVIGKESVLKHREGRCICQ